MCEETPSRLKAAVLGLLDEIYDPCSVATGLRMGLVEMGLVESVEISEAGDVDIRLRLTSPFCEMIGFMKGEAIDKISRLPEAKSITIHADAGLDWSSEMMTAAARRRRNERLRQLSNGGGTGRRARVEDRSVDVGHGKIAPDPYAVGG